VTAVPNSLSDSASAGVPDGGRKIRVKRYQVYDVDYLYFSAYRMRMEIVEAVGMDTRCFLYRRDPVDPYTGDVTDTFFSVCSPVDMEEYPPGEPDPDKAYPFFRQSFVELDFRATSVAMAAEQLIVSELNVLVQALDRLEDLRLAEDFWIGPFPDVDVSVSSPLAAG
jgi:hypothetical protein